MTNYSEFLTSLKKIIQLTSDKDKAYFDLLITLLIMKRKNNPFYNSNFLNEALSKSRNNLNKASINSIIYYHDFREINDNIKTFIENISVYPQNFIPNRKYSILRSDINNKEIIDYTSIFLLNYDKNLFKTFIDAMNSERILISKANSNINQGMTYPCFYQKPYIETMGLNNLFCSAILTHEMVHYNTLLNLQKNKQLDYITCENPLWEIYPYFLELLHLDYLKFFDPSNELESLLIKRVMVNTLYDDFNNLTEYLSKEVSIKEYPPIIDITIRRMYGLYYAFWFYEQYKIDPIKTKEMIKSFNEKSIMLTTKDALQTFNMPEKADQSIKDFILQYK